MVTIICMCLSHCDCCLVDRGILIPSPMYYEGRVDFIINIIKTGPNLCKRCEQNWSPLRLKKPAKFSLQMTVIYLAFKIRATASDASLIELSVGLNTVNIRFDLSLWIGKVYVRKGILYSYLSTKYLTIIQKNPLAW